MADSRAGAGNILNEPIASYSARKYRGALKKTHTKGYMSTGHRSQLKESPMAIAGAI